jgi:dienelactone hydrolase
MMFVFAASLFSYYATEAQTSPVIHIKPETALVDEAISIRVTGLAPGQTAAIKATMIDRRGREWASRAVFTADRSGVIDVSRQAPTEGSYSRVDAMGLFWSMDAVAAQATAASQPRSLLEPQTVKFDLEADGKVIASAALKRLYTATDVKARDVRDKGLVGRFYEPAGGGAHPAVLVLGGSEGGLQGSEPQAALLAAHGYSALALAYFGLEGLPKTLELIPLEYLKKGIDWLAAQSAVDRARLAVTGGSKGGELALVLGATFPELRAVVAYVPSGLVWQGIGQNGEGKGSSWTYKGAELPYATPKVSQAFLSQDFSKAINIGLLYAEGLKDKAAVEKAAIAVEKINGPVLLISGRDDQLWPSSLMSEMIIERLKKNNHRFRYEHLAYEGAGHAIGTSYLPTTRARSGGRLLMGGTPEGYARAQADSWPKVLRFLGESLKKEKGK